MSYAEHPISEPVPASAPRHTIVQLSHYAQDLSTASAHEVDKLYQDDAVWIITSSFIIFTMHSGFGLLESGSVAAKDEVNIMVKNVVDVVFGGLAYWALGYGLSYGDYAPWRNPFVGWGRFFYNPSWYGLSPNDEGWRYASFLFQMSLATTASTIVSGIGFLSICLAVGFVGAVAERAKLRSYICLGCIVVLIQALPAHWVWSPDGFFFQLGVVDFAGCCSVHLVGGMVGLVSTVYLRPRRNRFNEDSVHQMSSPTNALLGTFLLWWGWFGINAGSVWGMTDGRWRLAARASVATIMSSIGGGAVAIALSFGLTRKLQVQHLINGLLSSIVAITALCAIARPWHALLIGGVSAALSIATLRPLERFKIDDPVGVVPIHLTSSIWGMLAVGIFAKEDSRLIATFGVNGLLYGGGFRLLAVQTVCTLTVLLYSALTGLVALFIISRSPLGLRVTDYEEQIGADVVEHGLAGTNVARYLVEKPLSTKTFQTVTKAITKWKMMTKKGTRATRLQAALERRREQEAQFAQRVAANGGIGTSQLTRRLARPTVSSPSTDYHHSSSSSSLTARAGPSSSSFYRRQHAPPPILRTISQPGRLVADVRQRSSMEMSATSVTGRKMSPSTIEHTTIEMNEDENEDDQLNNNGNGHEKNGSAETDDHGGASSSRPMQSPPSTASTGSPTAIRFSHRSNKIRPENEHDNNAVPDPGPLPPGSSNH